MACAHRETWDTSKAHLPWLLSSLRRQPLLRPSLLRRHATLLHSLLWLHSVLHLHVLLGRLAILWWHANVWHSLRWHSTLLRSMLRQSLLRQSLLRQSLLVHSLLHPWMLHSLLMRSLLRGLAHGLLVLRHSHWLPIHPLLNLLLRDMPTCHRLVELLLLQVLLDWQGLFSSCLHRVARCSVCSGLRSVASKPDRMSWLNHQSYAQIIRVSMVTKWSASCLMAPEALSARTLKNWPWEKKGCTALHCSGVSWSNVIVNTFEYSFHIFPLSFMVSIASFPFLMTLAKGSPNFVFWSKVPFQLSLHPIKKMCILCIIEFRWTSGLLRSCRHLGRLAAWNANTQVHENLVALAILLR